MKIPKYVSEILSRSRYEFFRCRGNSNYAVGYTISIDKKTAYTSVGTLRKDVDRLCKWVNSVGGNGTAYVLRMPTQTHYYLQSAVVTIYDPVMQRVEKLINSENEVGNE